MRTVEMRRGSLSNSTRMSTPRRAKREVNDWQGSKDLVGCLDHILSSEKMADIAIVFPGQGKNGVSINAHKLILAARSPVFEGMFYGTESKKNRYFEETDIPPGPFKVLLKFIYTDIADLTPDNVLHVLNASEKYKIPSLTQQCCHHLIPILSPETVCGVLETACTFRLQELQMRCYVYIDENAAKVLFTEGFKRLSRAVMAKVIKRRSLDVPELDVYKAVVAWAETEMKKQKLEMTAENRRRTIGDQFALLRIPCIPQQQFADHVVKDNLLTGEEILQVFMHYTDSDKKPMKFTTTKARSPGLIVAERYTSTKDITTADKGALTGKISMETTENLILLGIVVKGVSALSSVTGTIDTSCGKSKEKLTITIQRPDSSDKCSIENMYFDKPLLDEKGKQCDMDFSVTFGHSVKQLGQQEKDISLLYSIGIGAQDTFVPTASVIKTLSVIIVTLSVAIATASVIILH